MIDAMQHAHSPSRRSLFPAPQSGFAGPGGGGPGDGKKKKEAKKKWVPPAPPTRVGKKEGAYTRPLSSST